MAAPDIGIGMYSFVCAQTYDLACMKACFDVFEISALCAEGCLEVFLLLAFGHVRPADVFECVE